MSIIKTNNSDIISYRKEQIDQIIQRHPVQYNGFDMLGYPLTVGDYVVNISSDGQCGTVRRVGVVLKITNKKVTIYTVSKWYHRGRESTSVDSKNLIKISPEQVENLKQFYEHHQE